MELREYEELLNKINSMQTEIDQQTSIIDRHYSRLKVIKGDLLPQEHRFLNAWYNFILYFTKKDELPAFTRRDGQVAGSRWFTRGRGRICAATGQVSPVRIFLTHVRSVSPLLFPGAYRVLVLR